MPGTRDEPILFGPFCLDRAAARLMRDGQVVRLTPKAFDLLQLLAAKPGRLVTKKEMLAAIWPDVLVSDASIKVCVSEARKALDDGAKTPQYIETVHRRGYRFIGLGSAKRQTRTGARPALPTTATAKTATTTQFPAFQSNTNAASSVSNAPAVAPGSPVATRNWIG